jgi:BirA family transcriptional regulator, biotin operon repressor / biotin---[acetyl-CoA-carboxylase] ligase
MSRDSAAVSSASSSAATGQALLRRLADGREHSGEALAAALGVSRAAVWKQVGKLKAHGLAVDGLPGRGYRLVEPLDLLDEAALRQGLIAAVEIELGRFAVFAETDSTNRQLIIGGGPQPGRLDVCVAEYQHAGRGRRGRRWTVPPGGGLCLSVGWRFAETPPELSALTLAVGVVVRRVLASTAAVEIDLKWPNDLVVDGRKLGGILVELTAEAQGRCHVVVGVGINVAIPAAVLAELSDWPGGAVDLRRATVGAAPPKTVLARELVVALGRLFAGYAATGFAPYRDDWRAADYLNGRRVGVGIGGEDAIIGTAAGIADDGALLLAVDGGRTTRVISGDVSVRPAQ